MTSSTLAEIRLATRELHQQLEDVVEVGEMLRDGGMCQERYGRLLTSHLAVHRRAASLYAGLKGAANPLLDWPDCERIQALGEDLEVLGWGAATGRDHVVSDSNSSEAFVVGFIYVVEGACHGNMQLASQLSRVDEFVRLDAGRFLATSGQSLRNRWPTILERLVALDAVESPDAVRGAVSGFEAFERAWHSSSRNLRLGQS